jgi:hypothetical protein
MAWWHLGLLLPAPALSSTRWDATIFDGSLQLQLMLESPSACLLKACMRD